MKTTYERYGNHCIIREIIICEENVVIIITRYIGETHLIKIRISKHNNFHRRLTHEENIINFAKKKIQKENFN